VSYPAGYPPASSRLPHNAKPGGASRPLVPTNDMRPPMRLSQRHLALVAERLSARDREVMAAVARFRVMSGGQLGRLFWPEGTPQTRSRLARHGLSRLVDLGVLAPLERRVGGVRSGSAGRVFALGLAGQRIYRPETDRRRTRRPHTPGERYLAHTLAVGELYVQLIEAQRWGSLELATFDAEPDCWRTYPGAWGTRLTLKPDAFVKVGAGDYAYHWLIEIDLASESLTTIERKTGRHLDYHRSGSALRSTGVAPRVAWIVPGETRAQAIESVLARLRPDDRKLFEVTTAAEAPGLLASGVGS
jgi:hypothetical protein